MPKIDNVFLEKIITWLNEGGLLFPQFGLCREDGRLHILGGGGFSSVYEMYNINCPELRYALKVMGADSHMISSTAFRDTTSLQWILSQESDFVVRILDARELDIFFDGEGNITGAKGAAGEVWEKDREDSLRLQFVLMEKLYQVLEKDRFRKAALARKELSEEIAVIRFGMEIGQALNLAHAYKALHRDVKLENIFWDERGQVYKLGDFGMAKLSADGSAETVVYTDGYGAPEIERRLYDQYNATADIYSFGITLYLLLNDLHFPGSGGYYPKPEVQYHPDFVFPAPAHASEGMTRIVRKMCSYRAEDRYQCVADILVELAAVAKENDEEVSEELLAMADLATETYREFSDSEGKEEGERRSSRAERKEKERIADRYYKWDCTKYLIGISCLLLLLSAGVMPESFQAGFTPFLLFPVAVMIEALLQKMQEFHLICGTVIVLLLGLSAYRDGFTILHLIMILGVIIGCPLLTVCAALSSGIWAMMPMLSGLKITLVIRFHDLSWIAFAVLMLVIYRYFYMRIEWERISPEAAFWIIFIYDKIFPAMVLVGTILSALEKFHVITVPVFIGKLHLVRTGIISFIVMCIFMRIDGLTDGGAEDSL